MEGEFLKDTNEKKEEGCAKNKTEKKKKKRKRNRCSSCNKKIPITAYPCKCGILFCTDHILKHDCTFDYQDEYKKKLKTNMPAVHFEKNIVI